MEILRRGCRKSNVHVHVRVRVRGFKAIIRELLTRGLLGMLPLQVLRILTCSMRSSREEECSGPAPSRPCGKSRTIPLCFSHFAVGKIKASDSISSDLFQSHTLRR